MKLHTLLAKVGRKAQMAMAALVIGGALMVVPGGEAHAAISSPEDCSSQAARNVPGVYLFSDVNYSGRCTKIDESGMTNFFFPDIYVASQLGAVGNDAMSSIKLVNGPGHGWDVILYSDTNILGQSYRTTSSIPDFTQRSMSFGKNLNDVVSSLSVAFGV